MTLRYEGAFPSDERFAGWGKTLPNGDKIRDALQNYPVVHWGLLVPSAERLAYDIGVSTQDISTLARRAGEQGVAGFYRAATGLPVVAHSGHVVELGATGDVADFAPTEDPIGAIRAADAETQRAVAESLAANHNKQQLLSLAQAIIAQAMQQE